MNTLAIELNEKLKNSTVYSLLSDYGKNIYLPKGIIVQGADAKGKKINATIGIATENSIPMCFNSVKSCFSDDLKPAELFPYSPMLGNLNLRNAWKEQLYEKNPSLKNVEFSTPCVTQGLTNALFIIGKLFVNENDSIVLPSLYWENYDLIFKENCKANFVHFDMFEGNSFNTEGLRKAISSVKGEKVIVLLNFPNNPTGYTPTKEESDKIVEIIKETAENNKKVLLILDDAYFGLFFEDDIIKESIFTKVAALSENIFAIKCDAATKEEMVWGFRLGFITFGSKNLKSEQTDALYSKISAVIRGTLSNCSTPVQNILLKAFNNPHHNEEKQRNLEKIKTRYLILKEALNKFKDDSKLKILPFNSGYFMSFKVLNESAEDLRQRLLKDADVGSIAINNSTLRIAFSSVDDEKLPELVKLIYNTAR